MPLENFTISVEVPEGYTILDYRKVQKDELFLDMYGNVEKATHSACSEKYYILKKKDIRLSDLKPGYKFAINGEEFILMDKNGVTILHYTTEYNYIAHRLSDNCLAVWNEDYVITRS